MTAWPLAAIDSGCLTWVCLQSLGVSREMQAAGYGLMCVGYAKSDLELELVEEDEVYDQQFGQYFAQLATDPNNRASIARDDFALELADMDE